MSATTPPDFVLEEVRLLSRDMTTPETNVSVVTAARSDSGAIEDVIRPPTPEATWIWADYEARDAQHVSEIDIGKYGLQTDIHKLFKLAGILPVPVGPVWQPARDFTVATWTWRNQNARENEHVLAGDRGKIGYQVDIDKYFKLDEVNPTVWKPAASPNAGPFELSTGASDAVAYHDYYRLQIAFEDVWAELIDDSMGTTAQAFYAKWDALMNEGQRNDLANEQYDAQLTAASGTIGQALGDVVGAQTADGSLTASDASAVAAAIRASIGPITQIQIAASGLFKSSFGLDLQNIQAELQLALDVLQPGVSGAAASVISALDAASTIISTLQGKLQQAAATRVAAFDLIPPEDIGGIDQLERFLNDVRIILGLPPATSTVSVVPKEDYDSNFDAVILNLKGGKDFLQSLADDLRTARVNLGWTPTLAIPGQQSLNAALDAVNTFRAAASDTFKQSYASDLNAITSQVSDAVTKFVTFVNDIISGQLGWAFVDTNPPPAHVSFTTPAIYAAIDTAMRTVTNLRSKYNSQPPQLTGHNNPFVPSALEFPEIETLFKRLSDMLKERYRFDVFAPASINYGLLLNYRQKWAPQSYQVGSLVKTIPLGAGEVQKYTTKSVIKKSRNAKELDESLRSSKEDKSVTQRVDAEIFSNANEKTDFNANAQGSFKIGVYDVNAETHFGKDQGVDSKNTKRDQRESVIKSAQEYRDQHRMEVTTDVSSEDEATSYREIRNPNDELTVTYLFYELQRRYLVSDSLYRATPVIMVANDVPAPHEIDQAWLVRHDWILKRAILDDSFLPALAYLATDYTGRGNRAHHARDGGAAPESGGGQALAAGDARQPVARRCHRGRHAGGGLAASTTSGTRNTASSSKSFFDPLGISQAGNMDNGTSNRARLEFANEALRARPGQGSTTSPAR